MRVVFQVDTCTNWSVQNFSLCRTLESHHLEYRKHLSVIYSPKGLLRLLKDYSDCSRITQIAQGLLGLLQDIQQGSNSSVSVDQSASDHDELPVQC